MIALAEVWRTFLDWRRLRKTPSRKKDRLLFDVELVRPRSRGEALRSVNTWLVVARRIAPYGCILDAHLKARALARAGHAAGVDYGLIVGKEDGHCRVVVDREPLASDPEFTLIRHLPSGQALTAPVWAIAQGNSELACQHLSSWDWDWMGSLSRNIGKCREWPR